MPDIRMCKNCYEDFHMDDGLKCAVCETEHCDHCAIKNGVSFHDLEDSWIYICGKCLDDYKEHGIEYIQNEINGEVDKELMDKIVLQFDALQ